MPGNEYERDGLINSHILKDNRIIYINGEINDNVAFNFNMSLLKLEQENSTADISVYINSPGGSVSAGLSMVDTMNLVSCDISTVCIGMAASMGAILLMCGTKGKRKILPHSTVLIHQPLGGLGGQQQVSDIEIYANEIVRTKKTLYQLMADATGQEYDKIDEDCDRDHILNAQEALEYGIVDEIVSSHKNREVEKDGIFNT